MNSTDWPDCPQNPTYIGDGVCDYANNNEKCNFDGGDCSQCMTIDGDICILPFFFNGLTWYSCTWDFSHLTNDKPWCSRLVDDNGKHVRGNWGNCGAGCPIPPDNRT